MIIFSTLLTKAFNTYDVELLSLIRTPFEWSTSNTLWMKHLKRPLSKAPEISIWLEIEFHAILHCMVPIPDIGHFHLDRLQCLNCIGKNGITDACRTADCCPLLSIDVHCCPLLPIVAHCCPLLPIDAHCCPLLSIVVHCCQLLPIVAHWWGKNHYGRTDQQTNEGARQF